MLVSALGVSACHEQPVVPAIPAGVLPKILTLNLEVKNAGVVGIGQGARLTGTVAYCLTCMVDVDHYEERVATYRLTLDNDLALETESGPPIRTGSWRVDCEPCDPIQIKKGELRKVRKAHPLHGISPNASLFVEYDARETGLAGSRAWIAWQD